MTITLDHVLAALVAVPCIVAVAKATDNGVRVIAILCLVCAVGAVAAPSLAGNGVLFSFGGTTWTAGTVGWVACGVVSIITGVRVAEGILSSLIITGGVLGALLALQVIARS